MVKSRFRVKKEFQARWCGPLADGREHREDSKEMNGHGVETHH